MRVKHPAERVFVGSLSFCSLITLLAVALVLVPAARGVSATIESQPPKPLLRIYSNFPECTAKRFAKPVISNAGVFLNEFGPNRYCTIVDLATNNTNDGSEAFYKLFSDSQHVQSIEIYAFSAIERRLTELLCKMSSSGVPVKIVLAEFQPDQDKLTGLARTLSDCVQSGGGRLIQYPVGGGIVSFHPKYYRVNYVGGKTALVVGSGHPQRGLSITFDHWVFFELDASDPILHQHNCFARTIDHMLERSAGPFDGVDILTECRTKVPKSKVDPALFFLPFDYQPFRDSISATIRESKEIDIAMSTVGSEWILGQLQDAIRRGVKVRVIVDDDAYQAAVEECASCQASPLEYEAWLSVLATAGADVRYITTNTVNNTCKRLSRMHHKIALFRLAGGGSVVKFGSANFTDAAFGRVDGSRAPVNIENAYLSSAPSTIAHFEDTFSRLWELGVSRELLPKSFASIGLIGPGC